MAVILPLCYVGCHCLVGHNQRAHRLQNLTHLTVVILDSATTVLTKHQSADTVVRRVDTTVMVLHVVLRMVGIVDSRQTTVVVLVIDGLALLFEVGCLLAYHIAQSIVGKGGDTAGRVVYLCCGVVSLCHTSDVIFCCSHHYSLLVHLPCSGTETTKAWYRDYRIVVLTVPNYSSLS